MRSADFEIHSNFIHCQAIDYLFIFDNSMELKRLYTTCLKIMNLAIYIVHVRIHQIRKVHATFRLKKETLWHEP